MADEDKQVAAVYVGWVTFKNTIEQLVQGLPNRIDRTVFVGQSWGVQSQLLPGLKFLGLTDDQGKPTQALEALAVPDEEERKKQLAKILRERYADLFALDLMKTTPAELTEQMGASYNATGDTREKAVRFFIAAVTYVGIPVSRLIKSSGNGGTQYKRRAARRLRKSTVAPAPEVVPPTPPSAPGTSKVFKLRTPDAELTISTSKDFFALVSADRKFIYDLTEQIEKYEQESESKVPSGQSQTNAGGAE